MQRHTIVPQVQVLKVDKVPETKVLGTGKKNAFARPGPCVLEIIDSNVANIEPVELSVGGLVGKLNTTSLEQ